MICFCPTMMGLEPGALAGRDGLAGSGMPGAFAGSGLAGSGMDGLAGSAMLGALAGSGISGNIPGAFAAAPGGLSVAGFEATGGRGDDGDSVLICAAERSAACNIGIFCI